MLNINVANLNKIFRDFYTLTNIRIVLLNKEKEIVMEYPSTKNTFCNLISKNEYWDKKCENCDRTNVDLCARTKNSSTYKCHLGLAETIVPIYDNNGILGYVMFGQVLIEDTAEKTKKWLKSQFSEADFEGITDSIENIPVKSANEFEACVTISQALATYIFTNQWIAPQTSEFIRHMDKFIENNLSQNITVDDICNEFHIRRTRFYNIAKECLGCSIASYIRKQRIHHACRMLRETDESISQIAEKVGFLDYGHFSRVFRQLQGISATNYRKLYQNK
ncbi:MAG: PocR ligand-binding domain-containing protein [Clostridia bacterium]|nr:PocR ligand-binding domain-containing protein [Clostridia bacterium]